MDERPRYASTDKSSVELIEREFTSSRVRSRARRERELARRADRLVRREHVLPALALSIVFISFMGLLLALWPVL
jgi:hypothetical protein